MNVTFEKQPEDSRETLFGQEKLNGKDEWLTPPDILQALGPFDLDPCAPINRPWPTAAEHFTVLDNGLTKPWHGRVWCNPPYGVSTSAWLGRCAEHGNAIALTFARTETRMFFDNVWGKAHAVLFFKGRLRFYHVSGKKGGGAGAPSVLIAYGEENAKALFDSGLDGYVIKLSPQNWQLSLL